MVLSLIIYIYYKVSMIELSQCPTCASEDRVTIAGKDFCMRCGSPDDSTTAMTESGAIIAGTTDSTTQNTATPVHQNEVTKFAQLNPQPQATDAVAAMGQPQPEGQSQTTQQPQSMEQSLTPEQIMHQTALPADQQTPQPQTVAPYSTHLQPNMASVDQGVPTGQPASATPPTAPPAPDNRQQQPTAVSQAPISDGNYNIQSTPQAPVIQNNPILDSTYSVPEQPQTSQQIPPTAVEQPPATQPTASTLSTSTPSAGAYSVSQSPASFPEDKVVPQVAPTDNEPLSPPIQEQTEKLMQIGQSLVAPEADLESEEMQPPSTQPLTMPIEPSGPQNTQQPKTNIYNTSLDLNTRNDSGIFSDAQLEELSKSTEAPIDFGRPSHIAPEVSQHNSATPKEQPTKSTPQQKSTKPIISKGNFKTAKDKLKSKKSLKPAGIGLSIMALFITGAYIWQVNYSALAFKIASSKAGMSATMPGYMPGGYRLIGEIKTNPGSVSYNLVNDSKDKKISISQTKTDWDSQALAENYVAPKAGNYLALQAQGLTVYMLGDSQATWVNKGTWYTIDSPNQSLTQDQAIKIATSL